MDRVITLVVLLVALLLPMVSWLLAAFGYPVHSLISEEGLRWLFSRGLRVSFSVPAQHVILCLLAASTLVSVCRNSRLYPRSHLALALVAVLTLLLGGVLCWLAWGVGSPLLNVTGNLFPISPFLEGLPAVVSLCVSFLAMVYAYAQGQVSDLRQFTRLLTVGFRWCGTWMLAVLLLSFDIQTTLFIFR
ncbi:MAG: hypothetical protein HUK03_06300 [Bacteroidaceae bacterium]|nr:hypothetical protein [Bacteroidaceae bacterium]